MTEQIVCANCGAGVRMPATTCWMCRWPLVTAVAPPGSAPREEHDRAWLAVVLIIAAMLLAVFVALLFEAPGFLVPYAVLATPVVAGLLIVAFRKQLPTLGAPASAQIQTTSQAAAGQATRKFGPTEQDGKTLVKVFLIVLGVIFASVMLMLIAFVIFFIICIAVVAGSSSGGHF